MVIPCFALFVVLGVHLYHASAQTDVNGYSLSDVTYTSTGITGTLIIIGDGSSVYGNDITHLQLDVLLEDANYVHVKITDPTEARWEIPQSVINRPVISKSVNSLNYEYSTTASPFTFTVTRKADDAVVFTLDKDIIYKNQYISFSTSFARGTTTFGLGESARMQQPLESGHMYTMWAVDTAAATMDTNLYSSFPYTVQMSGDGTASGSLLMNSNGMDVTLHDTSLNYQVIGGIVDLYVFVGPSPMEVVRQYTGVVGRPTMMPYWSLGFHNCKYGYESIEQVEQVVANYSAAGIPLDTQWVDIDYMQNYKDFTFDEQQFPVAEVKSFVDELHLNGQHFVPIVDPGIMTVEGYEAYERGLEMDIFVKDMEGYPYLGQVWPGPTHFPDFLHPNSTSYWTTSLKSFHDEVPVDGLWIDMNEVSNFCNVDGMGQVCTNSAASGCPVEGEKPQDCCLMCTAKDPTNTLDAPPYAINSNKGTVAAKTMAMSGTHYGNISVYDAHNVYGLTEQQATHAALATIRGKRPFLLTRSAFPSSGMYAAKWSGDNAAKWEDLVASVVSILDHSLFGVPMIGCDVCGFKGNTTEELCARWIAVGAFYPFVRNHNALGEAPQELYLWDSVAEVAKTALGIRYRILPFIYTLLHHAHVAGDLVAAPIWANYLKDATTLSLNTSQFMLGNAVMVSPVVTEGATSLMAYFPQDVWYSFSDKSLFLDASLGEQWVELSTPVSVVQVHVAGGHVLPLQQTAMTTTEGRLTPFSLLVALDADGIAAGTLFWDDGEQVSLDDYVLVAFKATSRSINSTVMKGGKGVQDNILTSITVMSPTELATPTSLVLNGNTLPLDDNTMIVTANGKTVTFQGFEGVSMFDQLDIHWH